jgi:hypothetical protein
VKAKSTLKKANRKVNLREDKKKKEDMIGQLDSSHMMKVNLSARCAGSEAARRCGVLRRGGPCSWHNGVMIHSVVGAPEGGVGELATGTSPIH